MSGAGEGLAVLARELGHAFAEPELLREALTHALHTSGSYIVHSEHRDGMFYTTEMSRRGRTGVYDVEVRNQRDDRVALFRGNSHCVQGEVVTIPTGAED